MKKQEDKNPNSEIMRGGWMGVCKPAAGRVTVAIKNGKHYDALLVTNKARQKFIKQISGNIGNIPAVT